MYGLGQTALEGPPSAPFVAVQALPLVAGPLLALGAWLAWSIRCPRWVRLAVRVATSAASSAAVLWPFLLNATDEQWLGRWAMFAALAFLAPLLWAGVDRLSRGGRTGRSGGMPVILGVLASVGASAVVLVAVGSSLSLGLLAGCVAASSVLGLLVAWLSQPSQGRPRRRIRWRRAVNPLAGWAWFMAALSLGLGVIYGLSPAYPLLLLLTPLGVPWAIGRLVRRDHRAGVSWGSLLLTGLILGLILAEACLRAARQWRESPY
jgi:hypothetical protein